MLVLTACVSLCGPTAGAGEEPSAGHYVYGHETETFQPCGSAPLWVRGSTEVLESLRRAYSRLTSTPYEPVYAELVGRVTGPAASGFAASYDGQFMIERVESTRRMRAGDCVHE